MNEYQKEQRAAFLMAAGHLFSRPENELHAIEELIYEYLDFRREVGDFLKTHFDQVCTHACYDNNRSACCSKEGIIAFFADVVINTLVSEPGDIEVLCRVLEQKNEGFKCIYLGQTGCLWKIKPIVCEMFLCDEAKNRVFSDHPELLEKWAYFQNRKKDFNWPDKPVLFDRLEEIFIQAGCSSPLMYFHKSPGLLRVKQKAVKLS
ncbi:MAG: hypothetical protein FP816_05100 [Desulfobacteraceae bacterium]|nr:hypothetical protein [Desulfobacteraceae bacterium]